MDISIIAGDTGDEIRSSFFLFANSISFYFFYFETQELLNAGNTLEEVYLGLRDGKWSGMNESDERWSDEPDNEEIYDATNCFPI